eukprot:59987_1
MNTYAVEDVKSIVEKELKYITTDTVDIAFNLFKEWININKNSIESKSAADIAKIVYDLPLDKLIQIMKNQPDLLYHGLSHVFHFDEFTNIGLNTHFPISTTNTSNFAQAAKLNQSTKIPTDSDVSRLSDFSSENETSFGQQFIDKYKNNDEFLKNRTGWDRNEIYQIHAFLFKHYTLTADQFRQHMNDILNTKYGTLLSKSVINTIKNTILSDEFDVEELYYHIKNGKNIPEFSERI